MLSSELTDAEIDASYKSCMSGLKPVASKLERVHCAIMDLCNMVSDDLVDNCKGMERGYKEQCAEIKRQKMLIRRAIKQVETAEKESQADLDPRVITREVFKEVEKIEKVPVEIINEIP